MFFIGREDIHYSINVKINTHTGSRMRVCVLISGRGSNMESLIRKADGYVVEAVISNKPDAVGLRVADGLGVRCMVEPSLNGIWDILDGMRPDLVCMAGFMRILPADLTERYRVMNIHPSLLPRYPGLRAVEQALNDGATSSGCTVHFADSGVDTGKIIAQAAVRAEPDDTSDTLAARILEWEHRLYPEAVRWYAAGPAAEGGEVPALRGRDGQLVRTAEPERAASHAVEMGAAYVRWDGASYIISAEKPTTPPYVAVVSGDGVGLALERIKRLAATDGRA